MPRHSNAKRHSQVFISAFFSFHSAKYGESEDLFVVFATWLSYECFHVFHYLSHSLIKTPRKPEMERKRRQRINECLSKIKQLIPEARELEVNFIRLLRSVFEFCMCFEACIMKHSNILLLTNWIAFNSHDSHVLSLIHFLAD